MLLLLATQKVFPFSAAFSEAGTTGPGSVKYVILLLLCFRCAGVSRGRGKRLSPFLFSDTSSRCRPFSVSLT